MDILIRLYRMHDLDIMLLKYSDTVKFSAMVKAMLKSYTTGTTYTVNLKDCIQNINPKELPYKKTISIKLNPTKDQDVINLLSNIKDGYRNSFIKHIIRLYCSNYMLNQFLIDENRIVELQHNDQLIAPFTKNFKEKTETIKPKIAAKQAFSQKEKSKSVIKESPVPILTVESVIPDSNSQQQAMSLFKNLL